MAIKTEYDIKFSCGHKETKDLSSKEAGKRASFAKWLSQKICSACFRKESGENDRVERLAAAEAFDKECRLDPLRGTDAQLKWASIIRMEVLTRANDHLVMDGGSPKRNLTIESSTSHARSAAPAGGSTTARPRVKTWKNWSPPPTTMTKKGCEENPF